MNSLKLKAQEESATTPVAKMRAVRDGLQGQERNLLMSTAKGFVAVAQRQREQEAVNRVVMIVPVDHLYNQAMQTSGKTYNLKKEMKAAGDENGIAELGWAHLHQWIALVSAIAEDARIPPEEKPQTMMHFQAVTAVGQLKADVYVAKTKPAWKQNTARIELLVSGALHPVAMEIKNAVVKTGGDWKSGVAPRQKHERDVIDTLIKMGEYQPAMQD